MDTLSEIINSLRHIKNDVKAEVWISSLREKGVQKEQMVIRNEGVFKRAFRKDVVNAKLSEINTYDEMVEIANSEQLEEYVKNKYDRWAINWMGGNTRVFISGEEPKKLAEEEYRAYKFLIEKNNVELNGVPIKDVVSFRAIIFLSLEEPEFYNITKFKRNEDGMF